MSQTKILAVVAVVAVVAIAAAAVFLTQGSEDNDEVKFLIQDNEGVYFWVEGSGDTVLDAFKDAVDDFDIPNVTYSVKEGEETGVSAMYGLQYDNPEAGVYHYWNSFTWDGAGWVYAETYMSNTIVADMENRYFALAYGDYWGKDLTFATPDDCVVWDGSTSGTVFTIQSPSGMWFKVNGTGTTVYDAFVDATGDHKIPFTPSVGFVGIDAIYGISMKQVGEVWHWWAQQVMDAGEWVNASVGMGELNSADNPVFKIVYL